MLNSHSYKSALYFYLSLPWERANQVSEDVMKRVKLLPSFCHGRTKSIIWTKRAMSMTARDVQQSRLIREGQTTTCPLLPNSSCALSPRCILMSRERRHPVSGAAPSLKRTGLYGLHMTHGANMVPFAGYLMPVQYSDLGVSESHRWTREKSSLFDVGHMYAVIKCPHPI